MVEAAASGAALPAVAEAIRELSGSGLRVDTGGAPRTTPGRGLGVARAAPEKAWAFRQDVATSREVVASDAVAECPLQKRVRVSVPKCPQDEAPIAHRLWAELTAHGLIDADTEIQHLPSLVQQSLISFAPGYHQWVWCWQPKIAVPFHLVELRDASVFIPLEEANRLLGAGVHIAQSPNCILYTCAADFS